MKCKSCKGDGFFACNKCSGEGIDYGIHQCDKCSGEGELACSSCEGKGSVGFLKWLKTS